MKKMLTAVFAVVSLFIASPQLATAADTVCVGVITGTHDNVLVPPNASCTIQNAVVRGNVKALQNATLQINASTIGGNVEGDQTRHVLMQFQTQVRGNFDVKAGPTSATGTTGFDILVRVGGNAKIEGNRGNTFVDAANIGGNLDVLKSSGRFEIEHNTVGGNIKIEENLVTITFSAFGNIVPNGNMEVIKNVGPAPKQVVLNTVSQKLTCKENSPPLVGGANAAQETEGQCF